LNPVLRVVLIAALGIAYLTIAHIGATVGEPAWLIVLTGCMPLSVAALVMLWGTRWRYPVLALLVIAASQLVTHSTALVQHSLWLYFIQDTGSNLFGSAIFGRTLLNGQEALCTRMARYAHNGGMPATVKSYCDRLTLIWALYFAGCALVGATLFLSGHIREWSWFANVLNWPMTFAFLVLEYPIRLMIVPARDRADLRNSIRGMIAANKAEQAARAGKE
jgi:uncharacterized membrane protein